MSKSEDIEKQENSSAVKASTMGSSLAFSGEISGDEDLVIRGTFKGSIVLKNHGLYIDQNAKVEADVTAAHVSVSGSLTGNIRATGKVVLSSEARMKGDITSAKVTIREGAQFRGGIRMAKNGA